MGSEIASLYAKLGLDSSQFQKGLTDSKGKLAGFKGTLGEATKELTGFSLGSLTTIGAITGIAKAVNQTAKDWSVYAESMQKSAALSGISTEEMSRLTQAADDFRVSQEALQSAMGMALKNGFVPTIDNLANLSDEYIAMEDPAERAALATKIFGRQWQQIDPLLRQGGAAIREGTAAIADNLVVTDKAVKENVEYIKAVDNLGDAWTGVKNTVGAGVIPTFTTLLNLISDLSGGQKALNRSAADFVNDIFKGTFLESSAHKAAAAAEVATDRFDKMAMSIGAVGDEAGLTGDELLALAASATDWEVSFAKSSDNATGQFDLSLKMIRDGLKEMGAVGEEAYQGLLLGMGQITPAAIKAYAETQIVIDKIKEMLAQGYSIDIIVNYVQNWQKGGGTGGLDFTGNDIGNGTGFAGLTNTPRPTSVSDANRYDEAGKIIPHVNGETGYYDNSGAWHYSTPHANGGSWMIPMGYGYEGYRMPGGQTASGGETVTITPKGKESASQVILTDEQLKKIGEASGNATAMKLMQLGML